MLWQPQQANTINDSSSISPRGILTDMIGSKTTTMHAGEIARSGVLCNVSRDLSLEVELTRLGFLDQVAHHEGQQFADLSC